MLPVVVFVNVALSHLVAASSAPYRGCKPQLNYNRAQPLMMWDIVWVSSQSQVSHEIVIPQKWLKI